MWFYQFNIWVFIVMVDKKKVIWNYAIIIFQSLRYAIGITMTCRTYMSQWHVGQDGIYQILQNYNGIVTIFPKKKAKYVVLLQGKASSISICISCVRTMF